MLIFKQLFTLIKECCSVAQKFTKTLKTKIGLNSSFRVSPVAKTDSVWLETLVKLARFDESQNVER